MTDNIVGEFGILGKYVDAPLARPSYGYIMADLWTLVNKEIMKQYDALDGILDKIISEPDVCHPNCYAKLANCLDAPTRLKSRYYTKSTLQLLALTNKNLFPALSWRRKQWHVAALFKRVRVYHHLCKQLLQQVVSRPHKTRFQDWLKYAIHNDNNYSLNNLSTTDVEFNDSVNPGAIAILGRELVCLQDTWGKVSHLSWSQ